MTVCIEIQSVIGIKRQCGSILRGRCLNNQAVLQDALLFNDGLHLGYCHLCRRKGFFMLRRIENIDVHDGRHLINVAGRIHGLAECVFLEVGAISELLLRLRRGICEDGSVHHSAGILGHIDRSRTDHDLSAGGSCHRYGEGRSLLIDK